MAIAVAANCCRGESVVVWLQIRCTARSQRRGGSGRSEAARGGVEFAARAAVQELAGGQLAGADYDYQCNR
jgi:hypothetical protein